MESYRINVLGGLSIYSGEGKEINLPSRKTEALIVYILFSEKESCEREELASVFWDDMSEENALTNLRVTLSSLKKYMGDALHISRRRVSINPAVEIRSDGLEFLKAISELSEIENRAEGIPVGTSIRLTEEIRKYKGDFLQGFYIKNAISFEDWHAYKLESLKMAFIDACQVLIASLCRYKEYGSAINIANELIHTDPYYDNGYRNLIQLYSVNGQRDAALDAFEKYKKILKNEFQSEPDPELLDLVEEIKNTSGGKSPKEINLFPVERAIKSNIPIETKPFFGRMHELELIQTNLLNPYLRLITLIGQGGTGKTRLAIEVAGRMKQVFPDGIWFVPLEGVVTPNLILPEIFKVMALTFPEKDKAIDNLVQFLNGHKVLMILDNFEHLISGSEIISQIINRTTNSKIILTSREMTGLPEEFNIFIEGLSMEPERPYKSKREAEAKYSPAVSMFFDRAQRIKPEVDFKQDLEIVNEICRLVGGMPLGIEIAAYSLKNWTLTELHSNIQKDIENLKMDLPEIPERQRSLISVFDTFWQQLSADEQKQIKRLSIFRGVVTKFAAEKVAGVSIFFLNSLVSKGLLQRANPTGFKAHSMHRRYVFEKLKQDHDEFLNVQEKHLDFYFNFLARISQQIRDNPQRDLLDEIEFEMNNIRTAISACIALKDEQRAMEFCEMLMPFWKIRGYFEEGYHWLNQTFALDTNANQIDKASALCAASKLVSVLGDFDQAEKLGVQSMKLAEQVGDPHSLARALNSLGATASAKGNSSKAQDYFKQSLQIYKNLRVQQAIAGTMVNIAFIEIKNKNLELAKEILESALITFRSTGDAIGIIHVLQNFSRIYLVEGLMDNARVSIGESLNKAVDLNAIDELAEGYVLLSDYLEKSKEHERAEVVLNNLEFILRRHNISLLPDSQADYHRIRSNLAKTMESGSFKHLLPNALLDVADIIRFLSD